MVGVRGGKIQAHVVDICDLFLALTVDTIISDHVVRLEITVPVGWALNTNT